MSGLNSFAVPASIVHAPDTPNVYPYRSGMGMISSAEWLVFFDDFVSPISTNVPSGWSAAIIDVGATIVGSSVIGAGGATGALYFDSDGATEGAAIYMPEVVQLVSGKRFFMETRVNLEAAADSDFFFGLSDITATVNPEDLWTTTAASLVACGVLDSAATGYLSILSDANNSGSAIVAGEKAVSSGAWNILGLGYDGSKLRGYINGKLAVTWTGAASTIPTGYTLAPFLGYRNGSAATNEAAVDYFRFVMER
jgi:hypothetical protein